MNILYYSWDEMIKNDAINAIKGMGHNIIEYKSSFDKYDYDEKNISLLKKTIGTNNIDIIFSFNYFPDVSRVANEKGISYVSWVYDNPHLTLNSETIFNEINIVFVFDTSQVEKYRKLGVKNIFYSPLPSKSVNISPITYKHDISFVGTLYDGEKDQFGQIKNLPDNLRGRIDGIITAQHNLYGADIIDETINTFYDEIKKNVKTSLGEHYRECDRDIFVDIVLLYSLLSEDLRNCLISLFSIFILFLKELIFILFSIKSFTVIKFLVFDLLIFLTVLNLLNKSSKLFSSIYC